MAVPLGKAVTLLCAVAHAVAEALPEGKATVWLTLTEAEALAEELAEKVPTLLIEARALVEAVKSRAVGDTIAVAGAVLRAVVLLLPPPLVETTMLTDVLGVAVDRPPLPEGLSVRLCSAVEEADGLAVTLERMVSETAPLNEGEALVDASPERSDEVVATALLDTGAVDVAMAVMDAVAVRRAVEVPFAIVPVEDTVCGAVLDTLEELEELAIDVEEAEEVRAAVPVRPSDGEAVCVAAAVEVGCDKVAEAVAAPLDVGAESVAAKVPLELAEGLAGAVAVPDWVREAEDESEA